MRELTEIKVTKISLVGSPANKKSWLLKKSNEDVSEVEVAVAKFLGVPLGDEVVGKEELVVALAELEVYKKDMPGDLADAIETLVKSAGTNYEEVDEEPAPEPDPNDKYPSFRLPGDLVKAEEVEEEDEPEEDDEDHYDPVQQRLARIEKKLDAGKEEQDPWPSLDPITPGTKVAVKKVKKVDPAVKQIAKKTSLASDEGTFYVVEKEDDEEDKYPSLPTSLFER